MVAITARCLLLLGACVPTAALQLPAKHVISRRATLGALVALPSVASAYDYKQRDYGDGGAAASAASKAKPVCEEGQRLAPDGFGGKKCIGEIKSVLQQIVGDETPAAPKPAAEPVIKAAAPPAPPPPPSKPLTIDELVANSIAQKESLLGRPLSDTEKADMTTKVKKLMS